MCGRSRIFRVGLRRIWVLRSRSVRCPGWWWRVRLSFSSLLRSSSSIVAKSLSSLWSGAFSLLLSRGSESCLRPMQSFVQWRRRWFRRRVRNGSGGCVATVPLRVFVCSLRVLVGSVVYGRVGLCSSGYASFVSSSSRFRSSSCLLARGVESSSLLCDCLSALH